MLYVNKMYTPHTDGVKDYLHKKGIPQSAGELSKVSLLSLANLTEND